MAQTTQRERDEMLTLRVTPDERKMVRALAEVDGVSLSDAVRMAVRRQHAERFGAKGKR